MEYLILIADIIAIALNSYFLHRRERREDEKHEWERQDREHREL